MAKSRKKTRTRKRTYRKGRNVGPHKKVRKSCRWCPRSHHNHTKSGDTHRFHGQGAFCRTHKTTKIGKEYCR